MDTFLFWNTRGASDKGLFRNLKSICSGPRPCLISLAETHTADASKFRGLSKLGFDRSWIVPSVGRSGGLAVAWDSNRISVSVLEDDRQFVHLYCQIHQKLPFFLTIVYAVPYSNLRIELWNNILRLSKGINAPWSVLGDFNDILLANERVRGRSGNLRRMQWFHDRISDCGLIDMGSIGPRMTWKGPKLAGCPRLFERLDRALANSQFLDHMQDSFLKVLPRSNFSNHNPILLSVGLKQERFKSKKPFRFEAMWLSHESFSDFLSNNWSRQNNLLDCLNSFKKNIDGWNRNVFGFVEKKIATLLARLNGIQNSKAYPYSSFLCDLELQLQRELEQVLRDEEVKWF
ncbi:hypothetical protein QN277_025707 [Acacia crassicarpa]|uniref:Endonuclease/exonuclease/phosphatase domain-containing protein n=1 Tax=Acacia crassicarpa TaxID=499986 RepID=A0AAE1MJW3_9FABA|nr:hypothetical protein QN277_025707 [Acacia crassicarpa]